MLRPQRPAESQEESTDNLSGSKWVTWANSNATNSNKMSDLSASFKPKAEAFIKALKDAGASVTVRSTLRSRKRAYLFHWSWRVSLGKDAKGNVAASQETEADKDVEAGVDIKWDHGDETKSKAGAQQMVDGFALAVPPKSKIAPSKTSKHITGTAIDMDITWSGKLKVKKKDGTEVEIDFMEDVNKNTKLHEVGESYGVKKLATDAPHWSDTGR